MIAFTPAFSPSSLYLLRDQAEVDYFASRGGAPEAALIDWATCLIKPDEAFIDVGAHVGTWTQHMARRCATVLAAEPQWSTYVRLCHGIVLANIKNVSPIPVALGNENRMATLTAVSEDGGGSTLAWRPELAAALGTERVAVRCLDKIDLSILNGARIGLIKLDVEGHERAVLEGAVKTIVAHDWPNILAEAWLHPWYATERAALIKFLESLAYQVQPVANWPEMLLATRRPAAAV